MDDVIGMDCDSEQGSAQAATKSPKSMGAESMFTTCEDEFVQLNFQLNDNARLSKLAFFKRQNYNAKKDILLNRMHSLNNLIDKSWLDLSLASFKVKCKNLFLNWLWTHIKMTNDNACALLTII